jgi:Tfp pilus assembly protein PilF
MQIADAIALHQRGRLKDAERGYRAILRKQPGRADAWFLLGVVQFQRGQPADAAASYQRALALQPDHAEAHNNLGLALIDLARPQSRSNRTTSKRTTISESRCGICGA